MRRRTAASRGPVAPRGRARRAAASARSSWPGAGRRRHRCRRPGRSADAPRRGCGPDGRRRARAGRGGRRWRPWPPERVRAGRPRRARGRRALRGPTRPRRRRSRSGRRPRGWRDRAGRPRRSATAPVAQPEGALLALRPVADHRRLLGPVVDDRHLGERQARHGGSLRRRPRRRPGWPAGMVRRGRRRSRRSLAGCDRSSGTGPGRLTRERARRRGSSPIPWSNGSSSGRGPGWTSSRPGPGRRRGP